MPYDGKVYSIYCSTGCTCCSYENHTLGFYKTKEDAERRIQYFLDPKAHNNPLSSQYESKGRYSVNEHTYEIILGCRMIVDDERVYSSRDIVETREDGSILNGIEERVFD